MENMQKLIKCWKITITIKEKNNKSGLIYYQIWMNGVKNHQLKTKSRNNTI